MDGGTFPGRAREGVSSLYETGAEGGLFRRGMYCRGNFVVQAILRRGEKGNLEESLPCEKILVALHKMLLTA